MAEGRRVYEERLRVIAAAPLDETERRAAREYAKQQLLKVLSEVMR